MNKAESKLVLELRAENAKFQKDIETANRNMEKFGQTADTQMKRAAHGFKEMDVASSKANHAIGKSSNKMNAFGMQMQDVVVQAQMGTNWFTIIAQQGSQLAGVFGPTGALFGGVLALSAALGGMLWRAMSAASEKAEEMRLELDKLYESTERAKMSALRDQIYAQEEALEGLREKAKATSKDLQKLNEAVKSPILRDTNMKAYMAALQEYADVTEQIQRAQATLSKLKGDKGSADEKKLETERKYYAELWKIEQNGQAFIDGLVKESLAERDKMMKEASDKRLREEEAFRKKLEAIESGSASPEQKEDKLYTENIKALQDAANTRFAVEFDINQLIQAERARHETAMRDISNNAAAAEIAREKRRVDFIDDLVDESLKARKKYEEDLQRMLEEYDPLVREKKLHDAKMAMLQNEHNKRLMSEMNFNAAIEKENIRHEKAMSEAKIQALQESGLHIQALMQEFRFEAQHSADYFEATLGRAVDGFVQGMSQGLAQAIVYGEDMRDVFDQVAKAIAVGVLQSFIQMGIQILINKALGTAANTAAAAEASVLGVAMATAYAPAAALASLATLGANSAPAMAGITATVGLAESLALTGMAHDGIGSVPKEGTWLLDKGERVLSSDHNERFVKALEGESRGGVSVTNVFQISAGVAGTVQAEIAKVIPAIQKMTKASVEQAIRSGGSMSRAVGAR